MIDYIYCREYGLQPAILNFTFGLSEANGNPPVIINQSVKQTSTITNTKTGMELVEIKRVLYSKLITLKSFNGYDNLYIGKKSNFSFQNVPFDFVNDKWKIRDLTGHPLNNTKFNVYDRPKIRSILAAFLSKRQDEVFNLLYVEISKPSGLEKFLNILSAVIELQDDFFDVMVPYEETFLDVPDGLGLGNTNGSTLSPPKTNTTTNNQSGLWFGLGLVGLGLYALKKKKII